MVSFEDGFPFPGDPYSQVPHVILPVVWMSLSAEILWHLAAPSSPWLLPFSLDELRPFPGVLCSWKLRQRIWGIKSWKMLAVGPYLCEKMAVGFGWQIYGTSNVTV